MTIPKVIHYCWFGGNPIPRKMQQCIDSWSRFCPDYEIKRWDECNFDVHMNKYTEKAYKEKKYAYLSDYARLWIIQQEGGIYLDTDVELLGSIDWLLDYESFFCFSQDGYINTGLGFGAIAQASTIGIMLKMYDELLAGTKKMINCPILNTRALEEIGFISNGKQQILHNSIVLENEVMDPLDYQTGVLYITEKTLSIHWYTASAVDWFHKARARILRPVRRVLKVKRQKG